jgi:phosphatidylglycerophosphatase A
MIKCPVEAAAVADAHAEIFVDESVGLSCSEAAATEYLLGIFVDDSAGHQVVENPTLSTLKMEDAQAGIFVDENVGKQVIEGLEAKSIQDGQSRIFVDESVGQQVVEALEAISIQEGQSRIFVDEQVGQQVVEDLGLPWSEANSVWNWLATPPLTTVVRKVINNN